jgi:hypothetical protein
MLYDQGTRSFPFFLIPGKALATTVSPKPMLPKADNASDVGTILSPVNNFISIYKPLDINNIPEAMLSDLHIAIEYVLNKFFINIVSVKC